MKDIVDLTDSEILATLLQSYGGDFYRWDKDGIPVLINVLKDGRLRGRLGLIEMIIKHGTDVNENGYAMYPPILFELHSKQPDPEIIKLLTKYGADINRPFVPYEGDNVSP